MTDKPPIDERRFWDTFAKALSTELRETSSIQGASGITHKLQALCVDDKTNRLILFSAESNPRVAALIQGDVQATFPDARVLVARAATFDLGVLIRGIFRSSEAAKMNFRNFKRYTDRIEKMPEARKAKIASSAMFAPIAPMIGAFQNIPLPMLDQIGNLLQQAAHLDWMEIFEALKEQDAGTFSVSKLYDFDSQAIDREYGVCPLPLYEFETTDWSLFEAGKDIDEIQARLKALDIFQYFFPPPDQLALALAERGVTHKPEIMEILNGSSEVGHPL
jgi:hypothetical protein